jgi:iron(III) transport system ATP-binding protein
MLPVQGPVPGGDVDVMVRPEQLSLGPAGHGHLDAFVRGVTYFGHDAVVELDLVSASHLLRARVLGVSLPAPGDVVGVSVTGPVRAFARGSRRATGAGVAGTGAAAAH